MKPAPAPLLFCLILFLTANFSHAQNLILNPGLEEQDTSRKVTDQNDSFQVHHVLGWYNPCRSTTDFFNSDGQHFNYGSRIFCRQVKAHSGNCYAGFFTDNSQWKEFIGVNLTEPLEAGKNYRVEMYLCISKKSKFAMSQLQLDFWDTSYVQIIGSSGYPRMSRKYPPVIVNNTGQPAMVGNWMKVSATFTAVGGEKSFIIGYYNDYFQSVSMPATPANSSSDPYVYYFVDDVTLTRFDGPPILNKTPTRPIIYFDVDKAVIKPEFYVPLNDVVLRMKQDAVLKIELDGYTDIDGSNPDNQRLSEQRAEAVKAYIVSKGIDPKRITTKGFAESNPAGEEKGLNRRVEFVYSH